MLKSSKKSSAPVRNTKKSRAMSKVNENGLLTACKKFTGWEKQTLKQKAIIVWFCISFVCIFVFMENLLLEGFAIASLALSSRLLSLNVDVPDEEQ